jgi:hypothetical protein
MGQEGWWPSGYVVLPAVDPCFSFLKGYSSFRGGILDGFSLFMQKFSQRLSKEEEKFKSTQRNFFLGPAKK